MAVPTIEIGGSPVCDAQIPVVDDMLGLFTEFTPKFVKRFRRPGEADRRDGASAKRIGRGAVSIRGCYIGSNGSGWPPHRISVQKSQLSKITRTGAMRPNLRFRHRGRSDHGGT